MPGTSGGFAKGDFVGGIIGRTSNSNATDITGCYSTGNISGVEKVGGVMGFCDAILSLSDCYSTGNISGQKDVGVVFLTRASAACFRVLTAASTSACVA